MHLLLSHVKLSASDTSNFLFDINKSLKVVRLRKTRIVITKWSFYSRQPYKDTS